MTTRAHHWARITVDGKPLWVSRDAYKVDGVRVRFTPASARPKAEELGGRLPFARELDARWQAAGLHNVPHPLSPATKGDVKHSALVDADIADDYEWIVGNCGKHWVADPLPTGARALYGWFYDQQTKHLAAGIPLHKAHSIDDAWVIQRVRDSSHNDAHTDYSMTGVFVRDTEPDEWWEIGEDGYVRHVVRSVPEVGQRDPKPDNAPEWLDPAKSPRERALLWSLAQVGHREDPPGSNTSPLIDRWAENCTRDFDKDGDEDTAGSLWNPSKGLDWCAVFATGGAHASTALPGDPPLPCGNRISGSELVADAKARGMFVAPEELFAGLYELQPGDILIDKRWDHGTTTWTWRSHVKRFVEWKDRSMWLPVTVDGNSGSDGQRVALMSSKTLRDGAGLWGVIRYDATAPLRNSGASKPVSVTKSQPPEEAKLLTGIDVSHHQLPSRIRWDLIAKDFSFVIARACYGTKPDTAFVEHVHNARNAGLAVGSYIFLRQAETAESQLGAHLAQLEAAGFDVGDIVPAVDLEDNRGNGDGPLDGERYEAIAKQVVDGLVSRFGDCLVYCERDTVTKVMGNPPWVYERPIWTAWPYSAEPGWPKDWAIHQYSWDERHAGYPLGPLDVNRARTLPRIRS